MVTVRGAVLGQHEWRGTLFRKLQGGFTGFLQNRLIETESSPAMSRRRLSTLKLLTIAVLAMLPALSAVAGPQQSQRQSRDRDRGSERLDDDDNPARRDSLSDAVRRVERDTRGEVLSAERVQFDGRDMHRVKVVDDQGRVRVFMQDPLRGDADGRGDGQPRPGRRPPAPTRGDDD